MKFQILLAGCSLWFAASLACAEDLPGRAASPLGRWVTSSGNLEVEVAPCGEALCGTVVRVLANRSMSRAGGEMKPADSRDPLDMKILSDFVPTEFRGPRADEPTEWRGTIYNRENAKTYRCIMSMSDAGGLMLRAYVGLSWFGRTSAWARPEVALGEAR